MDHSDCAIVLDGQFGTSVALPTEAVLRGLSLLATRPSLGEIAERQFVSRATVKTQAISIYHRVDLRSRSEAAGRAADIGVIESAAVPATCDFHLYPDDPRARLAR
jgi:LuxR family maltose regulon positive regulatory protein